MSFNNEKINITCEKIFGIANKNFLTVVNELRESGEEMYLPEIYEHF